MTMSRASGKARRSGFCLVHRGDAECRCPRFERRSRHVSRPVPIRIRLDDGPELGANKCAHEGPRVVPDGLEGEVRASHNLIVVISGGGLIPYDESGLFEPAGSSYAESLTGERVEPVGTQENPASRRIRRVVSSRTVLIVIGILVSAVFTYIAVRNAHLEQTVDALRETNVAWLVPSLALFALAFFIRAVRWQSLFPRGRPPLGPVVKATFVGYLANAILPMRAGEAARTVALNRMAKTPIAQTVGTVFVERAEDVLSLVFLLFIMLPWLPDVSWLRGAGYLALALMLVLAVCAVILLVWGERAVRLLVRRWVAAVHPARVTRACPGAVHPWARGPRQPPHCGRELRLTTLSWLVLGVAFWLVLKASGIGLSPLAGLLVVIGIGLA